MQNDRGLRIRIPTPKEDDEEYENMRTRSFNILRYIYEYLVANCFGKSKVIPQKLIPCPDCV